MKGDYTKATVLDIMLDAVETKDININDIEKKVNQVSKYPIKDVGIILAGKELPTNIILSDLIMIYEALSTVTDLPPASSIFEEEEIFIAKGRSADRIYDQALRLLKKKNVKLNVERKAEFVSQKYSDVTYVTMANISNRFGGKIKQAETKFKKDLCEFTEEEIEFIFADITAKSLFTFKSLVTSYFEFCFEKGIIAEEDVDKAKAISGMSEEGLEEFFEYEYFYSENELRTRLTEIEKNISKFDRKDRPQDGSVDQIIIPCIWLSWIGFDFNECMSIYLDDVDFEQRSILCRKTKKRINNIPEVIFKNITGSAVRAIANQKLIHRKGDEVELKNFTSYVRQEITKFNKCGEGRNTGKKEIRIKRIRDSGSFCRMLEYENKTGKRILTNNYELINSMVYIAGESKSMYYLAMKSYEQWKKFGAVSVT